MKRVVLLLCGLLFACNKSNATSITQTTSAETVMKLDADMKNVEDELATLGAKRITTLSVSDARKQPTMADAVRAISKKEGKSGDLESVMFVEDQMMDGPLIPLRVYTPNNGVGLPIILYFAGGGWVLDEKPFEASARRLANCANAIVVEPNYRKAPENKFPSAHDDAFSAYKWVITNAGSLKGDPKRIAVAGESAGGNLAIDVALAARNEGDPLPVHVLLMYPVVRDNPNLAWFTEKYFRTPADAHDARIDVLDSDLTRLPITTIVNAEVDPLREDGEALAMKLHAAKVTVDQHTFTGVTHGFFGTGAVVAKAREAEDYACSRLKKTFGE